MADRNTSPTDTREQAMQIRTAWANINSSESYGSLALSDLDETIAGLDAASNTISKLEDQLLDARLDYWEARQKLWDQVKHARLGAKLKHGEDSPEFERFGGTRSSQRQRPRLRAERVKTEA